MEETTNMQKTPDDILKESIEDKKKEIKLQEKKIEEEKETFRKLRKQLLQREKSFSIYKLTKEI